MIGPILRLEFVEYRLIGPWEKPTGVHQYVKCTGYESWQSVPLGLRVIAADEPARAVVVAK